MKSKNIFLIILTVLFISLEACNEDKYLEEEALSFYSPENSYVTYQDFQSAVTGIYSKWRALRYNASEYSQGLIAGTDIIFNARGDNTVTRFGDYYVTLNPTADMTRYYWGRLYDVIAAANTVIDRVKASTLTDAQKTEIESTGRFFRAYAYRYLVHLYGDVPLQIAEVTSPKTDFIRTPREEVLKQIIIDAEFAAKNLETIDKVADGKLSNLVAYHLLAETYIVQKEWDKAIECASKVINDPNMALMKQRFGSLASSAGDVFYDLFRVGNQNRKKGNKEALWVAQMEVDVVGGFLTTKGVEGNPMERMHVPNTYGLTDPAGRAGALGPRSDLNIGGRGVSFLQPTTYLENIVWQSDFKNDMRNSSYNYVRDFIYDNPASTFFGKSFVSNPGRNWQTQKWRWYPWLSKVTTPGQHPTSIYSDQSRALLTANAGSTYADQYYIRLPETILLRAEAYLGKGDLTQAANDINLVRDRAKATPVTPDKVTIDYILDERARELNLEEDRRITLSRVGKLVERIRLYNPLNQDEVQDFHALFPIPQSEIEANSGALLQQNPGYN